jgi:hypothetical protein
MTDREHRNALERRLEPLFDPVCHPRVDWSAGRWADAPGGVVRLRRSGCDVVAWFTVDSTRPLGDALATARETFARMQERLLAI